MGRYLTWLHLSDLHYYAPKTGWDAARVLRTLTDDLKQMQADCDLQPDFIFFTGDAAFGHISEKSGHSLRDQFDGAEQFFNDVRCSFKNEVSRTNFFLVPGNHDVNRESVTPEQTEWLGRLTDLTRVEEMLHSNSLQWRRYMERLTEYRDYLARHGYMHLLTEASSLIYSTKRSVHDIEVGIAGLNSAWSCASTTEKGKLWMGGRWQIEHLISDLSSSHIKIALIHHPQNWLTEYEDPDVRHQLERDFDFYLHGHEHQEWVEQADTHLRIAAGACYDRSDKENGYNFVRIDLETGITEIWLRHYHSKGGSWIPDIVPKKTNHDGRWLISKLPNLNLLLPTPEISPAVNLITNISLSDMGDSPAKFDTEAHPTFESYSSDLLPVVDAWVGREQELADLNAMKNGVVVVTGIGGQGKSTIVAKFLDGWKDRHPEGFWDWFDCREEGERFHTQLVMLIAHLSAGQITAENLEEADTKDIIRFLFEQFRDVTGVIVLDNVDHYVNVIENEFHLGIALLVTEALRVQHNLLFVMTCRPHVVYASPRFHEIQMSGFELSEAVELFRVRGVQIQKDGVVEQIQEICSLTAGHPLWLNLLAVQMSRNPKTISGVLQELRKGRLDDRARAMFKALWNGLNDRQRIILRCMSEVSYPETVDMIEQFARPIASNRKQTIRAFSELRALSLVVERGSTAKDSKFDLHPLVRSFIRTEYPAKQDRLRYIRPILAYFMRDPLAPNVNAPRELLERWTNKAELELASHGTIAALMTFDKTSDQLIAQGLNGEFVRVAKLILDDASWNAIELQSSNEFHDVINRLIRSLVEHNREFEARQYLTRYEEIAKKGTALNLRMCRTASYFEWFVGNYETAIAWGKEGVELQAKSNMDTHIDPSYTLALALRDSGKLDEALNIFAPEQTIDDIMNDVRRGASHDSSFYGNVGRCMQFKGRMEDALACYIRSALLLENQYDSISILNRGFAARWIAEASEKLIDSSTAYIFYRRAIMIWTKRSPLRISELKQLLNGVSHLVDEKLRSMADAEIDMLCIRWLRKHV